MHGDMRPIFPGGTWMAKPREKSPTKNVPRICSIKIEREIHNGGAFPDHPGTVVEFELEHEDGSAAPPLVCYRCDDPGDELAQDPIGVAKDLAFVGALMVKILEDTYRPVCPPGTRLN